MADHPYRNFIAITTPVHTDLDGSMRQLSNYAKFFGGDFLYLMHLSREAEGLRQKYDQALCSFPNAILLPKSEATSIYCTLGAHMAATEYLVRNGLQPEHIYFHSGSDLLFRKGLFTHIRSNGSGITYYRFSDGCGWAWANRLKLDKRLSIFLEGLSIASDNIYFGRIEGAYMRFEFWLEAWTALKNAYLLDDFVSDQSLVWPIEECAIPTYFLNKQGTPGSCISIETKRVNGVESRDAPITLEELEQFMSKPSIFGAKWFSSDQNDPALLRLLTLAEAQ